MWMVDTPERRSGLASAAEREEGGMLQTGTWVLPADESALDREKITARFDSRIFFYNFTCDQGEGEPVIWLQELFVIKRVHRCGISSNNRKNVLGNIFVHESHSRFYNTFGRWTKGGGMVLEEPDLWLRRKGFLKGIRLRGVFLPFPPFNYLETMFNGTNVTYGIYPEVIRILQVKKPKSHRSVYKSNQNRDRRRRDLYGRSTSHQITTGEPRLTQATRSGPGMGWCGR